MGFICTHENRITPGDDRYERSGRNITAGTILTPRSPVEAPQWEPINSSSLVITYKHPELALIFAAQRWAGHGPVNPKMWLCRGTALKGDCLRTAHADVKVVRACSVP